MNTLHVLSLDKISIFQQLQIEEALLRCDSRNWCILNQGSPPAIVMGISGKAEHLIDKTAHEKNPVPIIRRFSGGGTVYVDEMTCFITIIANSQDLEVPCCPLKIHQWAESIYAPIFEGHPFQLRENDYVLAERKFGGNAQYLRKDRWLHHSSLLWDFDPMKMQILKIPQKMPTYRQNRNHEEFLCRLKGAIPSRQHLFSGITDSLSQCFALQYETIETVQSLLNIPHRKTTGVVDIL
jgi:lipoate-protein ligase A